MIVREIEALRLIMPSAEYQSPDTNDTSRFIFVHQSPAIPRLYTSSYV